MRAARGDDDVDMLLKLRADVDELQRLGASRWGVQAGPWDATAFDTGFLNSWTNFAGGWQVLRARRIGRNVQLEGLIAGGTSGNSCVTLDAAWRPPLNIMFAAAANTGTLIRLEVYSNGNVAPTWSGGGTASYFTACAIWSLD